VVVPDDVISQPWLQLGRIVLVQQPPLPAWIGVLDTPWKAVPPWELTLYNAEYLFAIRAAERSSAVTGTVYDVVREMIRIANEQENLYILPGTAVGAQPQNSRVVEQGNLWDQMIRLLEETGHEMIIRHELNARRQLYLYVDVGVGLGIDTQFLLHDGPGKNMTVIDAVVNGKITNRVKGVSGQSSEENQLESTVLEDQASQDLYRTRSEVANFQNVTQQSLINQYAQSYLDNFSDPFLDLTVDAMNVGNAFGNLRVGNRLLVHAANVRLPGGVRGWRGSARVLAMAYDETQDTVRMTLRGVL
jgi:hypothetical protein